MSQKFTLYPKRCLHRKLRDLYTWFSTVNQFEMNIRLFASLILSSVFIGSVTACGVIEIVLEPKWSGMFVCTELLEIAECLHKATSDRELKMYALQRNSDPLTIRTIKENPRSRINQKIVSSWRTSSCEVSSNEKDSWETTHLCSDTYGYDRVRYFSLIKVEIAPYYYYCNWTENYCLARFSENWNGYVVPQDAENVGICSRQDFSNSTQFLGKSFRESSKTLFEIERKVNGTFFFCSDVKTIVSCFLKFIGPEMRFTYLFSHKPKFLHVRLSINFWHRSLHYYESRCEIPIEMPRYFSTNGLCWFLRSFGRIHARPPSDAALIKVEVTHNTVDIGGLAGCLGDYSHDWKVYRVKEDAQAVGICSRHAPEDMEQIIDTNKSISAPGFTNKSIPWPTENEKSVCSGNVSFFLLAGLAGFAICAVLFLGAGYAIWKLGLVSKNALGAVAVKYDRRNDEELMTAG